MRELLKKGIAVHHSGILPIIKEVCPNSAILVLVLFTV